MVNGEERNGGDKVKGEDGVRMGKVGNEWGFTFSPFH